MLRWLAAAPYSKLLLRHPAKEPLPLRMARDDRAAIVLEDLCLQFAALMNDSAKCIPADVEDTFRSLRSSEAPPPKEKEGADANGPDPSPAPGDER